jgi:hypothetical protein
MSEAVFGTVVSALAVIVAVLTIYISVILFGLDKKMKKLSEDAVDKRVKSTEFAFKFRTNLMNEFVDSVIIELERDKSVPDHLYILNQLFRLVDATEGEQETIIDNISARTSSGTNGYSLSFLRQIQDHVKLTQNSQLKINAILEEARRRDIELR